MKRGYLSTVYPAERKLANYFTKTLSFFVATALPFSAPIYQKPRENIGTMVLYCAKTRFRRLRAAAKNHGFPFDVGVGSGYFEKRENVLVKLYPIFLSEVLISPIGEPFAFGPVQVRP